MVKYVCWKDGTQLTDTVIEARRDDGGAIVVLAVDIDGGEGAPDAKEGAWTIVCTCPTDDCENTFSGDMRGVVNEDGDTVVTGRPQTASERYMSEAAKELGPDKSLTRASDSAKYVITNISLVAAVVGGFGIFSDARGGFSDYPEVFGGIVLAAAAAIFFAVVALLPRTTEGFDYDDLNEVGAAYRKAIAYRARWARVSTVALLIGIVLGAVVFFLPRYSHPAASLAAGWDGSGAQLVLDATAKASGLPEDARAVIVVRGISRDGAETRLVRQVSTGADEGGSASLAVKLPHDKRYRAYHILSTLQWEKDGDSFSESSVDDMTVTAPPFTPPPAPAPAPT